jgi:hypothetical protein
VRQYRTSQRVSPAPQINRFGAERQWPWWSHNGKTRNDKNLDPVRLMPSLFRFLVIVCVLSAVVYGGIYTLAVYFEPDPREVSKPLPSVKIRRQ